MLEALPCVERPESLSRLARRFLVRKAPPVAEGGRCRHLWRTSPRPVVVYGREEVHLLETGNRIWRGIVACVRSSKHIGVRRATDATHSYRFYPIAHASTDLPLPGNRARGMCAVFVARRPLRQNGCRRCSSRPSGFSVSVPHGRDDCHRAHPDTRGDASRGTRHRTVLAIACAWRVTHTKRN